MSGTCACIITCHNYARYLRECLDSCLNQTQTFEQVIVVDDASDDNTAQICAEYVPLGVKYLRTEYRDVAKARNAGAKALEPTDYLLFVDADNILSKDYRELLQNALQQSPAGVAYANLRFIGLQAGQLADYIYPYDYWRLRRSNFADACSLIRRAAWEETSGFRTTGGGLEDWTLWLEITRNGWDMVYVPQAELHYRKHAQQMSKKRDFNFNLGTQVMRDSQQVAIVMLFSGRTWALAMTERWIKALKWRKDNLYIVALDNSNDDQFNRALCEMLQRTELPYVVAMDNRQATPAIASELSDTAALRIQYKTDLNIHMARLYDKARAFVPSKADMVWCVEDDVEVPPDALWNLCLVLFKELCSGMVVGCLRSRFEPRRLIACDMAHDGNHDDVGYLLNPPKPSEIAVLSATGFFCSLLPRPVFDAIDFRPGNYEGQHGYYDWAASHQIRAMGHQIILTGAVRCGHWDASGKCLAV